MGKLRDLVKGHEMDFIEINNAPYWIHPTNVHMLYKVVKIFANLDEQVNVNNVNIFLEQNADCSVLCSYDKNKMVVIAKTDDRGVDYTDLIYGKESKVDKSSQN